MHCLKTWLQVCQQFPELPEMPSEQYKGRPRIRVTGGVIKIYRHPTAYHKRVLKKRLTRYKATQVVFRTAWNTPRPVWATLAALLPQGLRIEVQYADEDLGSNCGSFTLVSGDVYDLKVAPSDADAEERRRWVKFAFHVVWGPDTDPREYGLDADYNYIV